MELPMSSTTLHKHQALGRGRDLWFISLSGVQSWSCLKLIWGSLSQLSPLSYCCSNAVLFQDKVYCEPQRKKESWEAILCQGYSPPPFLLSWTKPKHFWPNLLAQWLIWVSFLRELLGWQCWKWHHQQQGAQILSTFAFWAKWVKLLFSFMGCICSKWMNSWDKPSQVTPLFSQVTLKLLANREWGGFILELSLK